VCSTIMLLDDYMPRNDTAQTLRRAEQAQTLTALEAASIAILSFRAAMVMAASDVADADPPDEAVPPDG